MQSARSSMDRVDRHEVLRGPFWDNPNSHAISHELLHGFRSTAAVMAPSLLGVRTVRWRPKLKCPAGVTLHLSQKRCTIVETH